jgi:hypothetical protein
MRAWPAGQLLVGDGRARPRTQVQAGRAAQQLRRRVMAQAPARRGQPAPAAPAGRRSRPGRLPRAGRFGAGVGVGGGVRRVARLAPRSPARAGGIGARGARVWVARARAGGVAPAADLQQDQVAAAPARRRARAAGLRAPQQRRWRAACGPCAPRGRRAGCLYGATCVARK